MTKIKSDLYKNTLKVLSFRVHCGFYDKIRSRLEKLWRQPTSINIIIRSMLVYIKGWDLISGRGLEKL